MTALDLGAAAELSVAVRWPHRQEDWQFGFGLGHGLVAGAGERLIGTAMWWPYGKSHATLGMIIVSPDYQKRGIGLKLMKTTLAETGSRTVQLISNAKSVQFYERLGFSPLEGRLYQHQGRIGTIPPHTPAGGGSLRPLETRDLGAIEALDQTATGMPRLPLIKALMDAGHGVALERKGKIDGYAMRRRFGLGHLIGPVVASAAADAETLVTSLAHTPGEFLRVDISEDMKSFSALLTSKGMLCVNIVTPMFRGTPLQEHKYKIYAPANQALG
jgi:GNAT superfamily N-acetyltransferase